MVLLIRVVSCRFRFFYLERHGTPYFLILLSGFFLSIIRLLARASRISLLVSWEFLGFFRFFLILFYGRWNRVLSSLRTSVFMRIGDLALVLGLAGFWSLIFGYWGVFLYLPFCVALMTKRAQFPFFGWLLRAMAAPTPVRALVHRRTLVIRGVLLLYIFPLNFFRVSSELVFVRILRLGLAGLLGLMEEDFKKLVALRTLSQVSFCLVVYRGFPTLCFLHLSVHAFVKRTLFFVLGVSIFLVCGEQDSRLSYLRFFGPFYRILLSFSLFSLCGLLFRGRRVSKELILRKLNVLDLGLSYLFLFFFGVFMTFLYCIRLWEGCYILLGGGSTQSLLGQFYSWFFFLLFFQFYRRDLLIYNWIFEGIGGSSWSFKEPDLFCFFLLWGVVLLLRVIFILIFSSEFSPMLFDLIFRCFLVNNTWEFFFRKVFYEVISTVSNIRVWFISLNTDYTPFVLVFILFWLCIAMLVYFKNATLKQLRVIVVV